MFVIPPQSRRDIVLDGPSALFVCPEPYLSTYWSDLILFLVQMISIMDSRYPISLVKIDPLTLELLPLF